MADTLKQTVQQEATNIAPDRVVIQYFDEIDNKTVVLNFDEMTESEQVIYTAYVDMCKSKMV